jgi:hypothetical protein
MKILALGVLSALLSGVSGLPVSKAGQLNPITRERHVLILGQEVIGQVHIRAVMQSPNPKDPSRPSYIGFDSDPTPLLSSRMIQPAMSSGGKTRFSGRIVYVDANGRESGVLSFTNARVSNIRLPALDKESNQHCVISLSLLPQSSTYVRGSNSGFAVPAASDRTWLCSDFKAALATLPPDMFVRAGPINMNLSGTGLSFAPFGLTYRAGGNQPPPPQPAKPTLMIQLLDSNGVNTMTFNLGNVVLKRVAADNQFIVSPPIVAKG